MVVRLLELEKGFREGFPWDFAGIAQLVEHNLAKVGVAGSSPVSRSLVRSFAGFRVVLLETGEQRGG